eukprot:TRINITY_DN4884_c1_g1_i4.p2 TRINITY_DN4884_c1_g1~~TRINITY_DN4884_c1_g1_i4.p2  ORF type:complete len:162 (-),score=3.60 TRINITY_DN4884_c1_g1_i4:681-1166(-)
MLRFVDQICAFGSYLFGIVYPLIESLRTLHEQENYDIYHQRLKQWIPYWCIYMALNTAEKLVQTLLQYFPLFYELKLFVVLWLSLPKYKGAQLIYVDYIQPFMKQYLDVRIDTVTHSDSATNNVVQEKVTDLSQSESDFDTDDWVHVVPEDDAKKHSEHVN